LEIVCELSLKHERNIEILLVLYLYEFR
jgi:hypothetical protein